MARNEEGAGHRHARLEEMILEELRGLFRDDITDPALASVAVTRLVLSVDYRHARVHYVVAPDAPRVVVEARLTRATPFLRGRIGEAIDMKRVPDLRFVLDATAPSAEAD
jgi:ribosome-binding factor A